MELADRSGEPPSALKAAWPEADFRAFAAYRARWPSAEARLDFWFAQVLAVLANVFRGKGKPAVNPTDLIPDWWGDRPAKGNQPQTVEDWKELLTRMVLAKGGKVIRPGDAGGK